MWATSPDILNIMSAEDILNDINSLRAGDTFSMTELVDPDDVPSLVEGDIFEVISTDWFWVKVVWKPSQKKYTFSRENPIKLRFASESLVFAHNTWPINIISIKVLSRQNYTHINPESIWLVMNIWQRVLTGMSNNSDPLKLSDELSESTIFPSINPVASPPTEIITWIPWTKSPVLDNFEYKYLRVWDCLMVLDGDKYKILIIKSLFTINDPFLRFETTDNREWYLKGKACLIWNTISVVWENWGSWTKWNQGSPVLIRIVRKNS